jgi:outer membrane lipoprotein-sorting protein
MRKIAILMITMLCTFCYGQTAKSVLDKAAAAVSNKSGVSADFTMTGLNGTTHGTIVVKGKKFHATTPQASIWFNGKTQWTYLTRNDEVNVSTLDISDQLEHYHQVIVVCKSEDEMKELCEQLKQEGLKCNTLTL